MGIRLWRQIATPRASGTAKSADQLRGKMMENLMPKKIKGDAPPKEPKKRAAKKPTEKIENAKAIEKPKNALALLKGMASLKPEVIPRWASDPERQRTLRMVVRAAGDFGKLDIAMQNRTRSPMKGVNDADLLSGDQVLLSNLGVAFGDVREAIQKSVKYLVAQSEIGLWLLSQPGLGAGWLAGYVLAEFPDVYDAGICLRCGTHLHRQMDGTYVHPVLPNSTVVKRGQAADDGAEEVGGKEEQDEFIIRKIEAWDGQRMDSKDCPLQGQPVPIGHYRMHERKPSTFARYAGISTEQGYACPVCLHNLHYDGKGKVWKHPTYTNHPTGYKRCAHNGVALPNVLEDGNPLLKLGDGTLQPAIPRMVSPRRTTGNALSFNSQLRSKLLGDNGVVDQFVKQRHPKYRAIYDGVKQRVAQRDPWRSKGTIDMMGRRAAAYRFIVDFFIEWRRCEGLPSRLPYEEQYLGVKHHGDYVPVERVG
jgi:uncharacterized ubiquitin-like protein YukD